MALGADGSSSPQASGATVLTFQAGPFGSSDVQVASFRGREEISKCYSFDVHLIAEPSLDESVLESAMLGQPASLTVQLPTYTRTFHGIVAAVEIEGSRLRGDRWGLRVQMVPRMWLMRRRRNSRVFQHQSVDEIVTLMLKGYDIDQKWTLRKQYPKREYCVQYQESDYHFVTRILAEAGISFYFEQPPGGLEDLLGGMGGIAETALSAASALGGPIGDAASALEALLPKEQVVFVDATDAFPPIDDVDGSGGSSLLSSAIGAGLDAAAGAIGGAVGSALGSVSAALSVKSTSPKLFFQHDARGGEDFIGDFSLSRSVRSKSAVFRMHDPSTPTVQATAVASVERGEASASIGVSFSNGKLGLRGSVDASLGPQAALLKPDRLEVFEHHHEYMQVKWPEERIEGRRLLNQERRKAWQAKGVSSCARLGGGRRFTLDDHLRGMLNQQYLVTRIEHSGTVAWNEDEASTTTQAYKNTFEAVPTFVSYCPRRPARTLKQTCETATVVGPAGEEIHVNHLGQVRVQFHWDRLGSHDDHSSCWIRSVQTWAGPQWGTQFIPRVGMEVLVAFEGGDMDRPIVTGCVYHHTHPTPFELPHDKTRSGFRTHSSPGGGGFNELSFEDTKGHEQVYVHAQHDLDEVVRHDHTTKVGRDETRHITNDQRETVGGDRIEHVVGSNSIRIDRDHAEKIGGSRSLDLAGDDETVIAGDANATIAGAERRTVLSTADHQIDDDHSVRVRGSFVTLVGRADAKRNYYLHVEGRTEFVGMDVIELSAEKSVVLRCGKSSIVVGPDRVEIVSPAVSVSGGGAGISLEGGKGTLRADSKASLISPQVLAQSSGGTLGMAGDVKLTSGKITMSSGGGGSDDVKDDSPKPTLIDLHDQDGKPLAYQRFTVVMGDGSERGGITDKDGKAKLFVEGSAKILFPDVGKTEKS